MFYSQTPSTRYNVQLFQAKFAAHLLHKDEDALSCIRSSLARLGPEHEIGSQNTLLFLYLRQLLFQFVFFAVALLNLYNRKAVLKEENNPSTHLGRYQ